jgi:hypothetical protein
VDRQTFIDRLRAWAARADSEVTHSLGTAQIAWQGQAGVLRALANVAATANTDPATLRKQIIADRQKTLAAWNGEREEADAALFTGETQAYELVLDLLSDVDAWDVPVTR